RARRHPPDRRAQRAELLAPAQGRRGRQARAPQARDVDLDPGVAAVGGVRVERRQPERHPVRARHPFETTTRFTLDLNAVPVLKKLTHLPVVVDPSHGTGHWEYVESMAMAAVAAGADGLLIEVHPRPEEALSDGPQSLKPDRFAAVMARIARVARAVDRDV